MRRRPRVVIIPTGNELVAPGSQLRPGDIVEFNSQIIGGFVVECGGEPSFSPIVPDDFGDIAEAVRPRQPALISSSSTQARLQAARTTPAPSWRSLAA